MHDVHDARHDVMNFVNMATIDDLKLIKLYTKRLLVWDSRLEDYYSSVEKKAALWKEVVEELGITKASDIECFVCQ